MAGRVLLFRSPSVHRNLRVTIAFILVESWARVGYRAFFVSLNSVQRLLSVVRNFYNGKGFKGGVMMNKKKIVPGLNTRVLWTINPRTRIHEDNRKNKKKMRQTGQKIAKQECSF
jgi:hypothetical protein